MVESRTCERCEFSRPWHGTLVCWHEQAKYKDPHTQAMTFHSTNHMRSVGKCGPHLTYFTRKS